MFIEGCQKYRILKWQKQYRLGKTKSIDPKENAGLLNDSNKNINIDWMSELRYVGTSFDSLRFNTIKTIEPEKDDGAKCMAEI